MEQNFECDNCLRKFSRKSHLEQHKNKKDYETKYKFRRVLGDYRKIRDEDW